MILFKDLLRWSLVVLLVLGLFNFAHAKPRPADDDDNDPDDADNPDDSTEDRDINKDGEEDEMVILILMDGFRWDYPEYCEMFGFKKLETDGVHAPYMEPIFPSLSYPNYYALTTGLYAESHGIVGNIIYDPKLKDLFIMEPHENASHGHWWDDAEPIWITATKNDRKTSLYRWPGCQVEYNHVTPFRCVAYSSHEGIDEFRQDLESAVTDIKDKGVRLAMVYVELADKAGHVYGPTSNNLKEAIHQLDDALQELFKNLKANKLADDVNVIVVSDHGMQDTAPDKIAEIELQSIIDLVDVKYILDSRAYVGIHPIEGRLDKVYTALSGVEGLRVYKKADIPEKYHLKDNAKTPPIIVIAKQGYYIEGFEGTPKQVPQEAQSADTDNDNDGKDDDDPTNSRGTHGYDPDEVHDMRGIFYAAGPAFKDHFEGDPISIVDIYNVLADIIDVEALPNNGSKTAIEEYLKPAEDDDVAGKDDKKSADSVAHISLVVSLACWIATRILA